MITLTKQSSPSIAVGKAGQWYTLLFTTSVSRPTGHAGWMENFINSNRIPGAREDRDWRASSHWGCRKYPSPPPATFIFLHRNWLFFSRFSPGRCAPHTPSFRSFPLFLFISVAVMASLAGRPCPCLTRWCFFLMPLEKKPRLVWSSPVLLDYTCRPIHSPSRMY